ncbi:MAG: Amuc_1100 family pilus-like protein [bacterium]
MKRHQITWVICGVLMAAVCLGVGVFLFSAMRAKNVAAEERNQNYEELQSIYQAKVFPSQENVLRVSEDQKALEAWLVTASNLVHQGDLQITKKSPTGFKQTLQATVRKLSSRPGMIKGKGAAAEFNFGFDKYLGTSDSLPDPEHVEQLSQQLTIIDRLCNELFAANILSLVTVTRETFDEQEADQPRKRNKPNRPGRLDDTTRDPVSGVGVSTGNEFFSKQRFSFEFRARSAAFADVLNRLAAIDLFVVVAEIEFRKTEDPLAKRAPKKKEGSADGSVAVDPATLSHVERIVTAPELEPPVSVKLDIDVYSFKGV